MTAAAGGGKLVAAGGGKATAAGGPVTLIVLAKAPLRGLVKTRLAAVAGDDFALAAYRAMLANVLAAAAASGLPTLVAHAPAGAGASLRELCGPGLALVPQAPGDLGARMAAALAGVLAGGAGAALLVGADLPLLDGSLLAGAAGLLSRRDAVLGPALDGGYYAIGFTRAGFCPEVFTDMAWSGPEVFARTLGRLRRCGRRVGLLPRLPDCDTAADLQRLRGEPWRGRLAGTPFGRFLAATAGDTFDRDPDNRLSVP
ncbi:MAG: TIGR04282 family arsenosugar biosynthesis glycosyltransferase [Solidesulfovibrio sp. DCME]|uniref:TIGR04282 family arsenosugar biosynthesis glycosyltransferase n=1 Tax=Solidesulfovibrio sp. DCME TaxID=3447380 RepID=UPI003D137435